MCIEGKVCVLMGKVSVLIGERVRVCVRSEGEVYVIRGKCVCVLRGKCVCVCVLKGEVCFLMGKCVF